MDVRRFHRIDTNARRGRASAAVPPSLLKSAPEDDPTIHINLSCSWPCSLRSIGGVIVVYRDSETFIIGGQALEKLTFVENERIKAS